MSGISFRGPEFSTSIFWIKMYSDGTPMIKTDQFEEIVAKADTIVIQANSLLEFIEAMYLYDAIYWQGGKRMNLVLPYLPGARQDRTNPTGDVLFTLRSVVNEINNRVFKKVVLLDPHSNVFRMYASSNFHEFPLELVARRLWRGYGGVIAPDNGAVSRAGIFAEAMGLPIVQASKTRDVSTGKLSGFEIDVEAGKHYIVIDDICDGGGTFIGLGEKIKEQGAYADLYVTHGIFSKGTNELKKYYKSIYTTDSIRPVRDLDVYTIKVVEDMINFA